MQQRNHLIDFLRFFASGWVVLYHLNVGLPFGNNPYRSAMKLGYLGVPIFFVVSGYCIALAAHNSKNISDFVTRRFFRVIPTYWFSLFLTLCAIAFHLVCYGGPNWVLLPKSLKHISGTMLLLTEPFSSVRPINWVYWSLTVEIFFYIVIAISLLVKEKIRSVCIIAISILALFPQLFHVKGLFFLEQWPSFGLGFALFAMQVKKQRKIVSWLIMVINAFTLVFVNHLTYYHVASFVTLGLIALSIYWRDLPKNFLSHLGDYSYAVYLVHVPIGVYMLMPLKTATIISNVYYNMIYDLAVLSIIILLSRFIFTYIEMPGIKMGKRTVKKISNIHKLSYTA